MHNAQCAKTCRGRNARRTAAPRPMHTGRRVRTARPAVSCAHTSSRSSCSAAATARTAAASDTLYRLPIGDPARKDREVPVVLDTMIDTASGKTLAPDDLAGIARSDPAAADWRVAHVVEFHRVQLQVLRALQRSGRRVLIGVEMYPYTAQAALDAWNAGQLAESAFVEQSRWYEHWGYHWNYYRDIFLFAREAGIPITAVNAPREVVTAVRKKGFANLTPDEAAHIPTDIEGETPDHMTFFKASHERRRQRASRHERRGAEGHAGRAVDVGRDHGLERRQGPEGQQRSEGHHGGARGIRPRGLWRRHRTAGAALDRWRGDDAGAGAGRRRQGRAHRAGPCLVRRHRLRRRRRAGERVSLAGSVDASRRRAAGASSTCRRTRPAPPQGWPWAT